MYILDGLGKLGEPLRFLLRRLTIVVDAHLVDHMIVYFFEEWCFDVVVIEWGCVRLLDMTNLLHFPRFRGSCKVCDQR